MDAAKHDPAARRLEQRNLSILAFGMALGLTGMPLVIFAGGLIGDALAPDPALATLPVAAAIVGVASSSVPAAMLMRRVGRRNGFVTGALLGMVAALLAAGSVTNGNFFGFSGAALLIGASQAFVYQYRFAAVESVSAERAPRAVSLVLLAGVAAGVIGPEIGRAARHTVGTEFAGSFLVLAGLHLLLGGIVSLLRDPAPPQEAPASGGRSVPALLAHPPLALAILAASLAFAIMSFIMTATPLSMHVFDGHTVDETARVIQAHAVAMYLPSLFTGALVARFGVGRMLATGAALLGCAAILGASSHALPAYQLALILLGIGWNLLFVSATVLLARSYLPEERFRAQALNDFIVFGSQSIAALGAGAALRHYGWTSMNAAVLVLLLGAALAAAAFSLRMRARPATARV